MTEAQAGRPAHNLAVALAALALAAPLRAATAPAAPPTVAPATGALIAVDPIDVPITDANRVEAYLRLRLMLLLDPAGGTSLSPATSARIRAALLSAGVEFARIYGSDSHSVDTPRLAKALQRALRQQRLPVQRVLLIDVRTDPR